MHNARRAVWAQATAEMPIPGRIFASSGALYHPCGKVQGCANLDANWYAEFMKVAMDPGARLSAAQMPPAGYPGE